jgi:hypothetical protein
MNVFVKPIQYKLKAFTIRTEHEQESISVKGVHNAGFGKRATCGAVEILGGQDPRFVNTRWIKVQIRGRP